MYSYSVCGLRVASSLPLPDLVNDGGPADVVIRRGAVDDIPLHDDEELGIRWMPAEVVFSWPPVGRIAMREGREIVVDAAADEVTLRQFILGPGLSVLLQQRGVLVLHASAVSVGHGVVAFLGDSGAGKSTTAAFFHEQGHTFVTDDLLPIDAEGSRGPTVLPTYPTVKLASPAVEALGWQAAADVNAGGEARKLVCRTPGSFAAASLPLVRVYMLEDADSTAIEPVDGHQAIFEIARHAVGTRFLDETSRPHRFQQCAAVCRSAPVRRLKRPRQFSSLPELSQLVTDDVARARG